MPTLCEQLKQFTSSNTAKLLGFYRSQMMTLEESGRGPRYQGAGGYVTYREDDVKDWAIKNVHAPAVWFNRFDDPNPRMVRRTQLYYNGRYYTLGHHEEAMLLLDMLYCPYFNAGNGGQLYRSDSPAIVAQRVQKPLAVI